jgi:MerR family transcriptional regulator, heat shock protein HspR
MATHEKNEPVYMIGVVVNMTQMHAQTIRLYEKKGLITPQRRSKNRLYSEADVERLKQIRRLTQDMEVNLAGVEIILDLLEKLDALRDERDAAERRVAQIEDWIRDMVAKNGGQFG